MKPKPAFLPSAAFTITDLLVVIAVVAVLASVTVVSLRTTRAKARMSVCNSNLRQVSHAVALYAENHAGRLPAAVEGQTGDEWWWYKEQVKGYAGLTEPSSTNDQVFACPDDRGYTDAKPFWRNPRFDFGSYVFNGVTMLGAPNIAGWAVSAVKEPQRTLLVMEFAAHAPLSWHKSKTGKENAPFYRDAQCMVGFVDGHVSFSKIYYDGYNAAYTRDPIAGYDYKYSGN